MEAAAATITCGMACSRAEEHQQLTHLDCWAGCQEPLGPRHELGQGHVPPPPLQLRVLKGLNNSVASVSSKGLAAQTRHSGVGRDGVSSAAGRALYCCAIVSLG